MMVNEFISSLKESKNNLVVMYSLNTGMKVKGYLKNVKYKEEAADDLEISIDEVKGTEDTLKKYSCKNKDSQSDMKKRLKVELQDIEVADITKSYKGEDTLYRIEFNDETLGIQVLN